MSRLIQISENVKKVMNAYEKEHNDIPWMDVYGLRNRIVHEFSSVDMSLVYDTLLSNTPSFLKKLKGD